MSEVQQRPPSTRGRGSTRGGRGGITPGARGVAARSSRNSNGDTNVSYSIEDQTEMGQLKKQYSAQLVKLGEMFSDWSTEDLLTALQENNGDLPATATKISEGPYFIFKTLCVYYFRPSTQSVDLFLLPYTKIYMQVWLLSGAR